MPERAPRTRPGLPPAGGGGGHLEGQLTSDLAAGGEATMRVYRVDSSTGWTSTTRTETVRDRAGFFGSAGDYVCVIRINGEWRPVVMGCPGFTGGE